MTHLHTWDNGLVIMPDLNKIFLPQQCDCNFFLKKSKIVIELYLFICAEKKKFQGLRGIADRKITMNDHQMS